MSAAALVWVGYIALLFIAAAVAVSTRLWVLIIAGMGAVYMWCAGQAAFMLGYETPAAVYLVMDAVASVAFWHFGKTRGARAFAATLFAQAALHVTYLAGLESAWPYWWAHTATAYVQLLVLIGWAVSAGKKDPEKC